VALTVLMSLGLLLAAAAVALAWSHARRVARATSGEAARLASALKRVPEADRVAELHRRSRPGTWEHQLAADVLEATSDAARVALVNEALYDVERDLEVGAAWPAASVRIALSGGLLLALVAYFVTGEIKWSVALLGAAGAGAVASFEAGRTARRAAEAQRKAVDALIAVTLRDLVMDGAPARSRTSTRRSAS
jgi:hypothetical protein